MIASGIPFQLADAQTNPNVNISVTGSSERPTPTSCNASESVTAQRPVFINRGDTTIEARWFNYNCTETVFFTIPPHSQHTVDTYETHLWRFYEVNTNAFINELRIIPQDPNLLAPYYTGRDLSLSTTWCNGSQGENEITVRFHNFGVTPVRPRWLNYECTEANYPTIEPGQTIVQRTSLTHVWRFYESVSNVLLAETRISVAGSTIEFGRKVAPTCNESHSFLPVTVSFLNLGDFPVEPRWLNYDCTETPYAVIPPHSSSTQATFKTHLWRFYLAGTETRIGEARISSASSVAFGRFLPAPPTTIVPQTTNTTTEPTTTTTLPLVFEYIQIITPSTTPVTTAAPIPVTTTSTTVPLTTTTTTTSPPQTTVPPTSTSSTTTAPAAGPVKSGLVKFRKVCKTVSRNKRRVVVCSLIRV